MKAYIIHENDEWTLPLKEQLQKLSVPFEDWHMAKVNLNTASAPPVGVFVAVIPQEKVSIVVKIKDGNMKAAEVAIAGILRQLKFLENEETKALSSQPILNSTVTKIGKLEWIVS